MPLSINVGLSRKASRDYQSTGVSINVTAELDQSLLAKPDELQAQVANLYAQAESALEQQAVGMSQSAQTSRSSYDRQPPRNNGGHNRGNGNGGGMTGSQRRAIESIARRMNIDPVLEARDVVGAQFDQLSIRQASELIDHLKAIQPSGNGNGR
jgi:N-acyl-D-aspartate/D-glutamate deacylase